MSILRNPIRTLRRKEYQLIKIKFTHRNMRKLAALYKEFKWSRIKSWYNQFRLRFKHTTRYWKHPNDFRTRNINKRLINPEYIYVNFWLFDYWEKHIGAAARTMYIESLNQESENLIRYVVSKVKLWSIDDLPF